MVVAIGRGGVDIPEAQALDHVWGYAIGNELTRRDLQLAARDMGRPWDWGKGFDHSAVCGPLHPVSRVGHLRQGSIRLSVNGDVKQDADLQDMIWGIPEQISIVSRSMELKPGDLIYSGTPAGVGPLLPGDVCVVEIEGLGKLTTTIGGGR
jgi:fumarylpyruvate hydrolase